ncbi:MAG: hypothetical protein GY929_17960 [Actinomycetia bacterium]|nr:hypothetical protein [Actinomycetes bacterium]
MTLAAPAPAPSRLAARFGLRAHVALGFALVLAVVMVTGRSASFTSDDGAYAYQVSELLDGGGWVIEDPAPDLEPETRPLINSTDTETGQIAYGRHPLVVLVAVAVGSVAGSTVGLWFLPVVGLVFAAAAAHGLAERLRAGAGVAAFWLLLVGPLLVNGAAFWAHAPSAAAAGGLALVALRAVEEGPSPPVLAAVAGLAALLPLLRSEGLLFVIAVAVAGLVLERRRALAMAGVALPSALIAVLGEHRVVADVTGSGGPSGVRGGSTNFVANRLEGLWHSALDPSYLDAGSGAVLLVALILVGLAVVRIRGDRGSEAAVLLVASAALWLVWSITATHDLVTGLVVVWPVLLLGLAVPVARTRADHFVGLSALLFIGAVIATQYADGGGAQWGGRFFSPAFVLLAALCAPAFGSLLATDLRWAVAAVLVVPVLAGSLATLRLRATHGELVDEATFSGAPIVITEVRALPRLGWSAHPDTRWLVAEPEDLDPLIGQLQAAGFDDVAVHGFLDVALGGDVEAVSAVLRVVHAPS